MRLSSTRDVDALFEPVAKGPLKNPIWTAIGVLVMVGGTLGSLIAAGSYARNTAASAHKAFATSSVEIAATLKLAIQHESDLIVSEQAFVLGDPSASEPQFVRWAQNVRALTRYPELQGFGFADIVARSQLAAFAARTRVASASGASATRSFAVIPPGVRPFYCLTAIGLLRNATVGLPPGFDLCAGGQGDLLFASRASGNSDLQPLKIRGKVTTLSFAVPIYRGGGTPPTTRAREAAFIGWVGMSIEPRMLLTTALHGHPMTSVALRFGSGTSKTIFRMGATTAGAALSTIDLHNGWTVQTSAIVAGGGLFGNASAVALLAIGIALSLLFAALIYLLGTGRARAVGQVAERTTQLRFLALHDPLTGLANRALILDRIEQMLARSRRNQLQIAAMFLDLDDFKDINDTLGHDAGDELLIAVSARLTSALREGDTVGRLGGDEFVILVEGKSLIDGVEVVTDRILEVLRAPFEIPQSDALLEVSASIGVAVGNRLTPTELLRDADIALYRAKAAGKRCAVVFASSMRTATEVHRNLELDLRGALEAGQFFLVYQPTLDLQTHAVTGVEALLRWQHPTRGVVQPVDFIPALEATGLILPVGAWVLHTACVQGATWRKAGHDFSVAVNVSAVQLERDRIVDDVRRALSASGFASTRLVLELTESTFMSDVEDSMSRLTALKALGVRLAADDFGTGYSSLAYLRKFPIDILKIDRSFVSGVTTSNETAALVHTLVQLGKVLQLETIAEGIENDEQRRHLQDEQVDVGQGFLFCEPLTAAGVDRFLVNLAAERSAPGAGGPRTMQRLPV